MEVAWMWIESLDGGESPVPDASELGAALLPLFEAIERAQGPALDDAIVELVLTIRGRTVHAS
jgi:hypothetical protein